MIDPAKLCRGLKRVALERGVTIHESTRVTGLERIAGGVRVRTAEWSAERDEPFGLARRVGLPFEPTDLLGRRGGASRGGSALRSVGGSAAGGPAVGSGVADHVVIATSAYSGWYPRLGACSCRSTTTSWSPSRSPRSSARRFAGAVAGDERRQQPVPLLPADRRRPDPVGRLRRVYHRERRGPALDRRPETFARLERHFRAAFRNWPACASRTAGAARSTRPAGSR